MAEKKNWGSTVAGWFIVKDADASAGEVQSSPETDEAEIRRAAAEQPLNVFATPPPAATGGQVDFDKVFEAASITGEERQQVTRTLDLLNSLPAGTEETVKKQIVMASLRAFGVPIEKIIEAAAEELQALEAYIRAGAGDTETLSREADERIREYEAEIVKLRTIMQQRVEEQATAVRSCNSKKLEVQKVLEFFGQEAVARVVRESPKLHEPTSGT
jgi:hypothetical protein